MRSKGGSHFRNVDVQGEAASADAEAAASRPEDPAKVFHEGGPAEQRLFRVGETALCGKKMPSRTSIAQERKSVPGLEGPLTLWSGADAAGDPEVEASAHLPSESPRVLENHTTSTLPALCALNHKAWARQHIGLQHCLLNILSPLLRPAAQGKKRIPFQKYCSLTVHVFTQEP